MTLTMFLLGALFVGLVVGLIYVVGIGYAPIVAVVAIGIAFWQWWSSDKVAMRAMRAREVTPEEAPELHGMIDRLCALADMPKPRVGVADTSVPNAFATGRSPQRSVVCVTTGILGMLTAEELEGVLAHELSHVANRDVVVMTIASFLATVAGLVMRIGLYGGMMGGGRRDDNNNAALMFLVVLVVSVVVYVLSFVLLRALSRYREFAADRGAAIMTGAPAQLASALAKITGAMSRIPNKDLRAVEGMNAFFIAPAVARGFSLSSIFATHPPTEKRIERLLAMQAQMEGAPRAAL
jgi:heat shock protein HtpX